MSESQSAHFPATSMPDRDWWSALWPDPEAILRKLDITPDMTVLDLCCGDGYFTAPLAKLVDGKVHALDLDPGMIEQAKMEVKKQGASIMEWWLADAREIVNLISEPVDYVLMANTFHGVPDKVDLCDKVHRVLRPAGKFGIVSWLPLPRSETAVLGKPRGPQTEMRMSAIEIRTVVEAANFASARTVALPPFHQALIFDRPKK